MMKQRKGSHLTDTRANENLQLSRGGPSHRQASGTNQPMKALLVHNIEASSRGLRSD